MTADDEDDLPEANFEGIFYRWLCPECDEVTDSENDVRGCEEKCTACGATSRVAG